MATATVDHYIPLFGRDFLASTTGWTAAERGHYITLLIVQWEQGAVPAGLDRLELVSPGVSSVWQIIEPKFPVWEDGLRRNVRMEQHRTKAQELKAKRSKAGKLGGRQASSGEDDSDDAENQTGSKPEANDQANNQAKTKPPSPSPSPSPSPFVFPASPECSAHTHTPSGVLGAGAEAWERFVTAWNRTERAVPWTPILPPNGWSELAYTPGWLDRATHALAKLPGCEWFERPVAITKFMGYVDRILAGEFDGPKSVKRERRKAVGGNL